MKLKYFVAFTAIVAMSASAQEAPADKKSDVGIFNIASDKSCIKGHNPFSTNTTERVKKLSESTLIEYITLAGAESKADVTSAYTTKKSTIGWEDGSIKGRKINKSWSSDGRDGNISSVDDSIARAIFAFRGEPDKYLRVEKFLIAGAKMNAIGVWKIIDPLNQDKTIGWYKARFMRRNRIDGQSWDLISVETSHDATAPFSIRQFCYEPGDVEANLAWGQKKKERKMDKKNR